MPITLRIAMQIRYLVICLVTAYPLLVACSNEDGGGVAHDDNAPIAFSTLSTEEQEVTTRATSALNRDFQVYGFKTAETYVQTVFNSYTVAYADGTAGKSEDNTNNYYYIGAVPGQTIKYWDLSAQKYQFFAFCPAQTVTGTTLSGKETMTATMSIDDAGISDCLYTELKTVEKSDYRKVVQMEFLRPIAQVRYRFVIRDDVDKNSVKIEESSFAPANSEEKIYTGGEVRVTHSAKGTTLAINGTTVLEGNAFTTPDTEGNYYSVLPVGSTPYGAFTLKALVSGVQKEATVPSEYMQWQPNHRYTYVFQIIDNSMTIVFVDMVEDDWIYGGYTQDEQYHW